MDGVFNVISTLKISDPQTIGEIIVSKGLASWSSGHSARIQAQKHLNKLADLGKIQKNPGFYRTLDCRSEYGEHSQKLTYCLAEIIKSPVNPTIYREYLLPNGLRPDAICLVRKNGKGLCFILEVVHKETPGYLQTKINEWKRSQTAHNAVEDLFGVKIPNIAFIVYGGLTGDYVTFEQLIQELRR